MSTKCSLWVSEDNEPDAHAYTDVTDIGTRDEGTVYVSVSREAQERGLVVTFGRNGAVAARWRRPGLLGRLLGWVR